MADTKSVPVRILPAGRYWITINHDDEYGTWLGWLDAFREFVHVENTSSREAEGDAPAWDFYIFTTTKPLVWERGDFPTVAGKEIKSVGDTVQRPSPEPDFIDTIPSPKELANKAGEAIGTMTTIVAIGVALGVVILITRKGGGPASATGGTK